MIKDKENHFHAEKFSKKFFGSWHRSGDQGDNWWALTSLAVILAGGQVAGDYKISCKRLRKSELPELSREAATAQLELIPNPPQAPSTPSRALRGSQIMKDDICPLERTAQCDLEVQKAA